MDAGAMFPNKAPQKICSVNFRPFSAYKERSEFGNEFRVQKNPYILFTRGTAARSHRGKSRATSGDAKLARTHFFDVLLKSCNFFGDFVVYVVINRYFCTIITRDEPTSRG